MKYKFVNMSLVCNNKRLAVMWSKLGFIAQSARVGNDYSFYRLELKRK